MNDTKFTLAETLLWSSEYDRSHTVTQIDDGSLERLYDEFWEWQDRVSDLCGALGTTLDELARYRYEPERDYVLSRLGAGTGLWDRYDYGDRLHQLAIAQGRLEGLIDCGDDQLMIC